MKHTRSIVIKVMARTDTEGLQRRFLSFPAQYSSPSSIETTEMIADASTNQAQVPASAAFISEEPFTNLRRVGPWPLKRSGSSQTTIVANEDFPIGHGIAPTDDSHKGKSTLSELLKAVDQHCEEIEQECKRTDSFLATVSVPEAVKAPSTRPPQDDHRIGASPSNGNQEIQGLPEHIAPLGTDMDVERQAYQRANSPSSCCPQCDEELDKTRRAASQAFSLVVGSVIVILLSPALLTDAFSRDDKAAIFDVQGDPRKTLRRFFGLMILPVTAVGVVVAVATWSLVRQAHLFSHTANRHDTPRMFVVFVFFSMWMLTLYLGLGGGRQFKSD